MICADEMRPFSFGLIFQFKSLHQNGIRCVKIKRGESLFLFNLLLLNEKAPVKSMIVTHTTHAYIHISFVYDASLRLRGIQKKRFIITNYYEQWLRQECEWMKVPEIWHSYLSISHIFLQRHAFFSVYIS